MVEWIAFLQKTVNRLFPQNPPKPLFKSTDKIEETVEEMIKQQSFVRGHSSELKGGEAEDSVVGKEEPSKKAARIKFIKLFSCLV